MHFILYFSIGTPNRFARREGTFFCSGASISTLTYVGHRETPGISHEIHRKSKREHLTVRRPDQSVENLFPDGFCTTLLVAVIVISSNNEADFCQCRKESKQCIQYIFPIQSTDNVGEEKESDFLSINLDSETQSSGNSTCSEYI